MRAHKQKSYSAALYRNTKKQSFQKRKIENHRKKRITRKMLAFVDQNDTREGISFHINLYERSYHPQKYSETIPCATKQASLQHKVNRILQSRTRYSCLFVLYGCLYLFCKPSVDTWVFLYEREKIS